MSTPAPLREQLDELHQIYFNGRLAPDSFVDFWQQEFQSYANAECEAFAEEIEKQFWAGLDITGDTLNAKIAAGLLQASIKLARAERSTQ